MSLTITVTRGYTMVAGVKPSVDDWNAGFLPSITVTGSVGSSDIGDDSITFALLNPNFLISGTTATAIASPDYILFGDVSAGDNRVITFQNFLKSVSVESATSVAFADFYADTVVYWDGANGLPQKMGVGRFVEQIISQPPELTTTTSADSVVVHDNDGTDGQQAKRVTLANLLPDITTAKTVNYPTQIRVNAKGLVEVLSSTEGASDATAMLVDSQADTVVGQVIGAAALTTLRFTAASAASWISLVSNEFTLEAGTYEFDAVVPYFYASSGDNPYVLVLTNLTGGSIIATSSGSFNADGDSANIPLKTVFTLSVASTLALQAIATNGFSVGRPASLGYTETYTQVLIRRLAAA